MKINHFTTDVNLNPYPRFDGQHFKAPVSDRTNGETVEQNVIKEDVSVVVDKLNNFLEPVVTNLKFVLHEELEEYYITIVNPQTNEVIKEIPPKKLLDMYVAMAKYMGLLVDEKI